MCADLDEYEEIRFV